MTTEERAIVCRLVDGEDPWKIDPEYGCTNPLTGYYPSAEVEAERKFRRESKIQMNTEVIHNGVVGVVVKIDWLMQKAHVRSVRGIHEVQLDRLEPKDESLAVNIRVVQDTHGTWCVRIGEGLSDRQIELIQCESRTEARRVFHDLVLSAKELGAMQRPPV